VTDPAITDQGRVATEVAAWPAADLRARVERVLDFAALVVDEFGGTGYADEHVPELGFRAEKVIAEAAMLAYAAAAPDAGDGIRERIDALTAALAPLARSRVARADVALHPERAFQRAVPHVLLTALGRPDPDFGDLVGRQCARVLAHAADHAPTVLAERDWVARVWRRPFASGPVVAGILEQPFDLALDSRDDAYGLTHRLFYFTDFGRSPRAGLDRDRLFADLDSLIARYLSREDYDLTAELLTAWPQLRQPWSPAAAFAFRLLADAQDAVGVLPCGNIDEERLAVLTGRDRTRYARATSYHTAFVWGILCASALLPDAAPPVMFGVPGPAFEAPQTFLAMTGDDRAEWRPAFADCSADEQRALLPLLCDIGLTQSLHGRDFRTVQAILAAADHHSLPTTSLARAAADVLIAIQAAAAL